MHHYVYQIISMTPNEEGVCRIYSGLRSCECLPEEDTEYMGSGTAIRGAIEKYGRDKFMKLIVAKFSTREEAHDYETQWLSKQFDFHGRDWKRFNKFNYNLRLNENSHDGFSRSPETRAKQSAAMTGKMVGEKNPNFGKQHSDEAKKKMSAALIGRQPSDETRKKLSEAKSGGKNSFFGKQHSDEAKKKMSAARVGKMAGEKNPNFGKPMSDEQKKKIGEANSGEKSANFKGITIGTNSGKHTIVFCGEKDIKTRGFDPGTISKVVNGKLPHHKKFSFTRSTDPIFLQQLLDEDNFVDEESKERIQEFLSQ